MKKQRGILLLPLLAAVLLPLYGEDGEDTPAAPPPPTVASQQYPEVACTTNNAMACADILQLASDTRDELAPLLQLGKTWRFPVHIYVVTNTDPLAPKVKQESTTAIAADGTIRIEAFLPANDPNARVFVQRQFVTALLWEKFFAQTKTFDTHTRLDIVPVWLIEGLREWVNDDPEHDRSSIVRRAASTQHAPTLDEVASWSEISDDRLLGLWQRAFCYYLVNSLTRKERRGDFQQWLAAASTSTASAKYLFPTEANWQQELLEASNRSHDIVFTWDQTASQLADIDQLAIPGDKPDNTKYGTLDTVLTFPRSEKLLSTLQQKNLDLTNLELRAHLTWRPIIALYRFGLAAVIQDDKSSEIAAKFLQQASSQRALEMKYHQKLVDYINWFEVTKDFSGDTSYFHLYFSTAQAMEKIQADPDHPNPIRAQLLHVESQL